MSETLRSPDGQHLWDGGGWQPVVAARPQQSPDGRWWWDGNGWLAVPTTPATPPPAIEAPAPTMASPVGPRRNKIVVGLAAALVLVVGLVLVANQGHSSSSISSDTSEEQTAADYCGLGMSNLTFKGYVMNSSVESDLLLPDAGAIQSTYTYDYSGGGQMVMTLSDTYRLVVQCPNGHVGYAP